MAIARLGNLLSQQSIGATAYLRMLAFGTKQKQTFEPVGIQGLSRSGPNTGLVARARKPLFSNCQK